MSDTSEKCSKEAGGEVLFCVSLGDQVHILPKGFY